MGVITGLGIQQGKLLFNADDAVYAWFREAEPTVFQGWCIGVVKDGKVAGAACLANHVEHNKNVILQMTGKHSGWVQRESLCQLYEAVFRVLKVWRITVSIRATHEMDIKLLRGFGFVKEGRMKKLFCGEEDMLILRLTERQLRKSRFYRLPAAIPAPEQVVYMYKDDDLHVRPYGAMKSKRVA